jgi:hypothetical protein
MRFAVTAAVTRRRHGAASDHKDPLMETINDDDAKAVLRVDDDTLDSLKDDLDLDDDSWTAGDLVDATDLLDGDD